MSERVLGDLAELTVGHVGPMASHYVDEGIPFLRSLNVKPFRLDLDGVKFVPRTFHEELRKSALSPGDVVVVRTGAPGTAAVVPQSLPIANCSDVVIVRPGPDLDARYLCYLINSAARGYIESRTVGAVQQHFNVGAAKGIPIPAGDITEQRRIAAVLGSFDDLIETNRQLLHHMVATAATIGAAGESRKRIGDVASLARGLSYKGSGLTDASDPAAVPMINLANYEVGIWWRDDGLKFYTESIKPSLLLAAEDLLIANTDLTQKRDILGRALLVPPKLDGATHSHHTSRLAFTEGSEGLRFLAWAQLQSADFRDRAKAFATGTTVTALPREAVLDYELALPKDLESASNAVALLLRSAWQLEAEIVDLALARDELLPLLMSGKVCVSESLEVA